MELAFSQMARRVAPAYAGLITNLLSACSHQHGGVQAEKLDDDDARTGSSLPSAMEYQRPSGERVTVVSEAPKNIHPRRRTF